MEKAKTIKPFSIKDAREVAAKYTSSMGDDFIALDDISLANLSNDTIRLGFFTYCFCTGGSAKFMINTQTVEMSSGDLFIGVGDQVFSKLDVSEDFHARMILVSHQSIQDGIAGLTQLWPFLQYLYKYPVTHLTLKEQEWAKAGFDYITWRMQREETRYRRETMTALIRLFYFDVCDILSSHCMSPVDIRSGSFGLFDKFIQLLSANFKKERNVSWYSNKLCITPKYLSEVVKTVSGKTAGQWITEFVVIEIKQLLANTSLSIKEVSQRMNFTNQSFLGKYFHNATGFSPREYRQINTSV